ncbi:HD domain-containing protein [Candidatus Pacearchaeota archaeon]|nr:HD domain-containing protein [Candidatus Pacearchaeota archaeon]
MDLRKIEEEIKQEFHSDSTGHDIYHLKRVLNLALHIQEKEGGDKEVIAISALLHDIHRIIEKETGKYCTPKDSLETAKKILEKVRVEEEKIRKILHCIEFHEEYSFSKKGKTALDKETLILQDADNLDAMGAIGIARGFMFGGAHNIPMWLPDIAYERKFFDESEKDVSEIHHFYSKLLKLKDNMNTETAKKMALERHKFMEEFLKEFFDEWRGEK